MEAVTSRRNPLIVGLIIFVWFTLGLFILYNLELKDSTTLGNTIIYTSVALFFLILSLRTCRIVVPQICLDKDIISFNGEHFKIEDISSISLTGKRFTKLVLLPASEASTLTFKNGVVKHIFDDLYNNAPELKLFLKNLANQEVNKPVTKHTRDVNDFIVKGYPILNVNQLIILGSFIFSTYNILSHSYNHRLLALVPFFVLVLIIFSFRLYYFELRSNLIIVKNHNFYWTRKKYFISDVREVVFETHTNQSYSLRIITQDFKSKLYQAGSLNNKDWKALQKALEVRGIVVRDEIHF